MRACLIIFSGLIAAGLGDSDGSGSLTREKKDVGKLQSIAASLMGGYLPSKYSPNYYPGGTYGYNNYNYNRQCDCRGQIGPANYPSGSGGYFAYKYRPTGSYPTPPIAPPPSRPIDDTVVVFPRPATTYGVSVSQQPSVRLPAQPSLPPPPPPPSSFSVGTSFDASPIIPSGPPPPPPVVTYQKPVVVPSASVNLGPTGYSYDRPSVSLKI